MPLTHTEWDGHEATLEGDLIAHDFLGESHLWGEFNEPALAAIADAHLDNEYELGRENVFIGAEEANEAEADLDAADFVAEDFAIENDDYLANEAYVQDYEIPETIFNAEHGLEEDLLVNLY